MCDRHEGVYLPFVSSLQQPCLRFCQNRVIISAEKLPFWSSVNQISFVKVIQNDLRVIRNTIHVTPKNPLFISGLEKKALSRQNLSSPSVASSSTVDFSLSLSSSLNCSPSDPILFYNHILQVFYIE